MAMVFEALGLAVTTGATLAVAERAREMFRKLCERDPGADPSALVDVVLK